MTPINIFATALIQPVFHFLCFFRFLAALIVNIPALVLWGTKRNKNKLESLWNALRNNPLGPRLFSTFVNFNAPYTGSVDPLVVKLSAVETIVEIVEYPWLRNPFGSIHALALGNAGELSSGLLAVTAAEAFKGRAIVNSISLNFTKKGRGKITFHAALSPEQIQQLKELATKASEGKSEQLDLNILVKFTDSKKDEIGTLQANWVVRTK